MRYADARLDLLTLGGAADHDDSDAVLVGGGHGSGWLLPIRGRRLDDGLTESQWVHCGCAAMVRFQAMGLREE